MIKKINRVVSFILAMSLILVGGQILNTLKVEAAGGMEVTVLNGQGIYTPNGVLQQIGLSDDDLAHITATYIVNDATYIKLKYTTIGGENVIIPYTVGEEIGNSDEYKMGSGSGHYKVSSIKEKAGAYADGYVLLYGTEAEYNLVILIPQSKAAKNGLAAEGTKTDDSTCAMYRLYNPNSGEHFYTANEVEKNYLVSIGWNDEGLGWVAPAYSGAPVYRMYNPNTGDHHYTTNAGEALNLAAIGWNNEGIGWYSDDVKETTLYRMYNPNCTGAGSHHYTVNYEEAKNLRDAGWRYEGRAWYGL